MLLNLFTANGMNALNGTAASIAHDKSSNNTYTSNAGAMGSNVMAYNSDTNTIAMNATYGRATGAACNNNNLTNINVSRMHTSDNHTNTNLARCK